MNTESMVISRKTALHMEIVSSYNHSQVIDLIWFPIMVSNTLWNLCIINVLGDQ